MNFMGEQQKYEIIKALAYGETPQQAAEAEGVSVSEVQKVQRTYAANIAEERETLRKAGYIHG
jgi:hypothetical protein